LSDPERMFFVSLPMNQILGWTRAQPGTTSLRAIVYMDEIFGYLPPSANPPSKMPMLTMLKQARAFGVGLVLATQNPVDLDYKALSNAGTWFIGRLQTERDKARLLDGLESATASGGGKFDRSEIDKILSSLGSRVFLMNNTHEDAPEIFQTRWVLSYLRGPLTRDQIKALMDPLKASAPTAPPSTAPVTTAVAAEVAQAALSAQPPALPPDVQSFYIPARGSAPLGSKLFYQPFVLGAAKVNFSNKKVKVDVSRDSVFITPITNEAIPLIWNHAQEIHIPATDLEKTPRSEAYFSSLPSAAGQSKNYTAWNRDFSNWLYGNQRLELFQSPSLNWVSNPGEDERDFRIRMQQIAREQRDELAEELRKKYAPKIATLQERLRRAQQNVEKQAAQAKQAQLQTAISVGATLLGAFTGRKTLSHSNIGRATTTARGVSRSLEQNQDVTLAKETVETLQKQLSELQAEFDAETAALQEKIDPLGEELEKISIKPNKSDIQVQLIALVWAPHWQEAQGNLTPAW
jgi:hypothetical protein